MPATKIVIIFLGLFCGLLVEETSGSHALLNSTYLRDTYQCSGSSCQTKNCGNVDNSIDKTVIFDFSGSTLVDFSCSDFLNSLGLDVGATLIGLILKNLLSLGNGSCGNVGLVSLSDVLGPINLLAIDNDTAKHVLVGCCIDNDNGPVDCSAGAKKCSNQCGGGKGRGGSSGGNKVNCENNCCSIKCT